jgi:excisionase family DNA binding protein
MAPQDVSQIAAPIVPAYPREEGLATGEANACSMCTAHRPHLLYRVADVADALSISRAKVYELIAAGSLPSVRLDGCRRIRHHDLLQFIARLRSVA